MVSVFWGQGGGIVGEGEVGAVNLSLRELPADGVVGDGDVRGGVRVAGGGEASPVVVAVGGDDAAFPGAGGETTGGGVGVAGALAIIIFIPCGS